MVDEKLVVAALDAIAAKLGTGAEVIWSALLKQAFIEALLSLLVFVPLFMLTGYGLFCWWRKDYVVEDQVIGRTLLTIFWCIALLAFLLSLPLITAGFINPEYYAMRSLVRGLR